MVQLTVCREENFSNSIFITEYKPMMLQLHGDSPDLQPGGGSLSKLIKSCMEKV
jgi:hypothetical protein